MNVYFGWANNPCTAVYILSHFVCVCARSMNDHRNDHVRTQSSIASFIHCRYCLSLMTIVGVLRLMQWLSSDWMIILQKQKSRHYRDLYSRRRGKKRSNFVLSIIKFMNSIWVVRIYFSSIQCTPSLIRFVAFISFTCISIYIRDGWKLWRGTIISWKILNGGMYT